MATRLERGLKIFLLLQKGEAYNALDLSKLMGVTRRTIFRDMALLKEMGLPVAFDPHSSSYSYDASRMGRSVEITPEEMREFLVRIAESAGLSGGDDQQKLLDRVAEFSARLPAEMRKEVESSLFDHNLGSNQNSGTNPRPALSSLQISRIQQAIMLRTEIGLIALDRTNPSPRLIIIPTELRCDSAGWRVIGQLAREGCEREFDLGQYSISYLID